MLQVPPPNPRKRQRSESPEQTRASQPPSKKQSLHHPSLYQHPPAFWDNLSKIWLTKLALRELDRRNREAASSPSRSPHRRAHRPVTRKYIADQRNGQVSHCTDYLRRCTPKTLKDIRLFARHGGPDLSDIRNVRMQKHSPTRSKLTPIVPRIQSHFPSRDEFCRFSSDPTANFSSCPEHRTHHEYNKNKEFRGL